MIPHIFIFLRAPSPSNLPASSTYVLIPVPHFLYTRNFGTHRLLKIKKIKISVIIRCQHFNFPSKENTNKQFIIAFIQWKKTLSLKIGIYNLRTLKKLIKCTLMKSDHIVLLISSLDEKIFPHTVFWKPLI